MLFDPVPMLWIALHLPQLPLQAFQRGLPLPEPCAVAERQKGFKGADLKNKLKTQTRCAVHLFPDFIGDFLDEPQLVPLLFLGQDVSFLGGGKTALRADA